jgi:hypothetical protein
MNTLNKLLAGVLALALVAIAVPQAFATDTTKRLFDRGELKISTGSATATMAAQNWTGFNPILTIAPQADHALYNCRVVIDLAKASTGFAAGYTTQTIQFVVSRKVDGTNWRQANNTATTALTGTNAASQSIEIFLGEVGPTEQVRIEIKLSAENADIVFPYVVMYRAGAAATFTSAY